MSQYEDTVAADLEFQDQMNRPKTRGSMTKKEKQREKEFRKNRRQARGKKWIGGDV